MVNYKVRFAAAIQWRDLRSVIQSFRHSAEDAGAFKHPHHFVFGAKQCLEARVLVQLLPLGFPWRGCVDEDRDVVGFRVELAFDAHRVVFAVPIQRMLATVDQLHREQRVGGVLALLGLPEAAAGGLLGHSDLRANEVGDCVCVSLSLFLPYP